MTKPQRDTEKDIGGLSFEIARESFEWFYCSDDKHSRHTVEARKMAEWVRKREQLSEQQGYQRGLQEALEIVGENEPLKAEATRRPDSDLRNEYRAELRKKLSEKMNE